jgi:benzoate membrane transport protein
MSVLAGSAQAALEPPKHRDAAVVTLLVTASGITLLDINAPVWGLIAGAVVYGLRGLRKG